MTVRLKSPLLALALAAWGLIVGVGHLLLGAYAGRPGEVGDPPARWPAGTAIEADPSRPNLLIFLHPRCPCSPASVAELAGALPRAPGGVAVHVVVTGVGGVEEARSAGLTGPLAGRPGCRIWADPDGEESRRFGVATSGHALVYRAGGRLAFSGGLTASRGHRGANHGLDAALAAIRGERPGRSSHPVFGCPLEAPAEEASP